MEQCCQWNHVRPCGPIVILDSEPLPGFDEVCACGCAAHDERCGGGEWWGQDPWMAFILGIALPFDRWLKQQPPQTHRGLLKQARRGVKFDDRYDWVLG